MHFNPTERILILIDGPSLHATTRDLAIHVDFRRLLEVFRKRACLVRAVYYATVRMHDEQQPIRPLLDWLEYNGYSLVTKAQSDYVDAQGYRQARDDVRVEMSVDAMDLAARVDHVVLFAGHSSFTYLCKALQRRGQRITVVSSIQTSPPMLADDLRRQADQWVDLVDLEPLIGRSPTLAQQSQHAAEPAARAVGTTRAGRDAEPDPAPAPAPASTPAPPPTAAPITEAASPRRTMIVERRTRRKTETRSSST